MEKLVLFDVFNIIKAISQKMTEKRETLIALDSLMGDGDLGITMDTGFRKMVEDIEKYPDVKNIGKTLKRLGFAMANEVPSSMGTIISTGIMKSTATIKEKEEITLVDCVQMLTDAINGIEMLGKANRGEKTLLDSLYPAKEKLEKALINNEDLRTAFKQAYEGAREGVETTVLLRAVHGRAARFSEDSIGKQDAGATVVMYIFEAIDGYFECR